MMPLFFWSLRCLLLAGPLTFTGGAFASRLSSLTRKVAAFIYTRVTWLSQRV